MAFGEVGRPSPSEHRLIGLSSRLEVKGPSFYN